MAQDDIPSGSPASGAAPGTLPRWLFLVGFAACGAAICAYHWATPRDGQSLLWFLVDLMVAALLAGVYLFQLARFGILRWAIPVLPFWVLGAARRAAEYLAGGWAGGWGLGVAGAAAGAVTGVAAGWLFARWVLPSLKHLYADNVPK